MRPSCGRLIAFFVAICAATSLPAANLCTLTDPQCVQDCEPVEVTFHVDPNQFVAPQNSNDPPRRQVTTVVMNDATFVAEAILLDSGAQGFFEDAGELGSRLMIVQPDGSARLLLQPGRRVFEGTCLTRP